jgi:hypothetical protein
VTLKILQVLLFCCNVAVSLCKRIPALLCKRIQPLPYRIIPLCKAMKVCTRCRVPRPDEAYQGKNGRVLSSCSNCRQAHNAAQSRRRMVASHDPEPGPSRKRRRVENPPSSSDDESRFRNATPQSSGEQRAQRAVSTGRTSFATNQCTLQKKC